MKHMLTGWLLMLSVVGVSAASPELTKGKALYATCVACHQADGRGNMAMKAPGIGGQERWYLEAQFTGMVMRPMALTLADDQAIHDVIAYIKTLGK